MKNSAQDNIHARLLRFVTRTNWILFALATAGAGVFLPREYALGVFLGGVLVTVNFHLLARTLRKALTPPQLSSPTRVLIKYYLRFLASGVILFILIRGEWVHPVGLVIGLSVVVGSILLATACEIKHLLFKEAL